MKEIFTYAFKDEHFINKICSLYGLIFLAVFLLNMASMFSPVALQGNISPLFYILLFVAFITLFPPIGYFISCIKNIISGNNTLPDFNIKQFFLNGAKFAVSFGLLCIFVLFVIYILGYMNNFCGKNNLTAFSFIIVTFSILFSTIMLFLLPGLLYNYSKNNDFFAFLRFPSLLKSINEKAASYMIKFLIFAAIVFCTLLIKGILLSFLNYFGFFGLITYSVLYSFALTYALIVISKLVTISLN